MGFAGQVMDSVKGIHLYYIIGLFIFITLFIIILIRTYLIPKDVLEEYKNAIFENEDSSTNKN